MSACRRSHPATIPLDADGTPAARSRRPVGPAGGRAPRCGRHHHDLDAHALGLSLAPAALVHGARRRVRADYDLVSLADRTAAAPVVDAPDPGARAGLAHRAARARTRCASPGRPARHWSRPTSVAWPLATAPDGRAVDLGRVRAAGRERGQVLCLACALSGAARAADGDAAGALVGLVADPGPGCLARLRRLAEQPVPRSSRWPSSRPPRPTTTWATPWPMTGRGRCRQGARCTGGYA